jgi:hypothetical protein
VRLGFDVTRYAGPNHRVSRGIDGAADLVGELFRRLALSKGPCVVIPQIKRGFELRRDASSEAAEFSMWAVYDRSLAGLAIFPHMGPAF